MEKFDKAILFSGGGTRMMIYLGMYAALEEFGVTPNVIIASCGGSFAAVVINAFSDNLARKNYLKSEEFYDFIISTKLTRQKKLSKIGIFTFKKQFNKANAPYIEDVFNRYLVEMNQDLSLNFPTLKNTSFSAEIPTVIVGSELLFNKREVDQTRGNRKLYQKIFFTDKQTAKNIKPDKLIIESENFQNSAIAELPKIETAFSMLDSTRISISDMFYVEPALINGKYYAGGAVDLVPIELGNHLANHVLLEKKQKYNNVEEALVRSVLGYSGNERLKQISLYSQNQQIDTTNIKNDLKGHYLEKIMDWKKMEIAFSYPKNFKEFKIDMEMQWQYGYNQTLKSLKL